MIYLYGFVPPGTAAPPADLEGVGGGSASLLGLEGLAAVVGEVPEESYGAAAVERYARDLDWLARQGVAHERVVTWFVDRGEIVPVPLMTLYATEAHLVADATARRDRVLDAFQRLGGCREWDLKVSYDAVKLEENLGRFSEDVAALDLELREASPGKRYLLERKRNELVRSAVGETARRLARGLLERLARHADETVTLPLPREAGQLPVVLRAALLVRREDEAALQDAMAAEAGVSAEAGIAGELTGPWAPYRFVEDDHAA